MEPAMLTFLSRRDAPTIFIGAPSSAPYTNPSLTANLVCRVLFGLLANIICLVPLRLLYRNGEFAAVIFIFNVEVQNLRNIVNALVWRNDDMQSWWPGYGMCDVDPYIRNISVILYSTCLLAIMRNLSIQVGSLRAHPLTQREKRRRNLVQALIIFPLPITQMALMFPLTEQRYFVGTLVGCNWPPAATWPYIVFMVLPPAFVSLITAGYAVITYIRFRQVAKTTKSALSSNHIANMRSQRARRRLYLMVVSILVPFLPIVLALTIGNFILAGPLQPFDYNKIHHHDDAAMPWNSIVFLPSDKINWVFMNNCYITIISAVPIFIFFGMTKDAMNCYRVTLLHLGLGKLFPCLQEEYNPDKRWFASSSRGHSSLYTTSAGSKTKSTIFASKLSSSSTSSSSSSSSSTNNISQGSKVPTSSLSFTFDRTQASYIQQPPPSVPPPHSQDIPIQAPLRNPFLFRTRLNPIIPFDFSPFKSSRPMKTSTPTQILPLEGIQPASYFQPMHHPNWSDEESQLLFSTASTPSILATLSSSRISGGGEHYNMTMLPAVLHKGATRAGE